MTPFAALLAASGLSQREAGDFLRTNESMVRDWARGKSRTPPGVISEMVALLRAIQTQDAGLLAGRAQAVAEGWRIAANHDKGDA